MRTAHIVLGMGYGDEGKGVFSDYLAATLHRPVVIRFNGGHQCGHTVLHPGGHRHVFSNFGAGSFRAAPTFISPFCTIDPTGIVREFRALQRLGTTPVLYIDPLAMVTTPFDKFYNINDRANLAHGTVGVGFGATVERNQGPYKLYARDLFHPGIFTRKLDAVRDYYRNRMKARGLECCLEALELEIMRVDQFLLDVKQARDVVRLLPEAQLFGMGFENCIFEGGQGILLDMDCGMFPHVTRSNTTSKNAFEMLRRNDQRADTTVHYLTRAYQTRHGNGWMSTENHPVALLNNEQETNGPGGHQGEFRTGILDRDMLKYALDCDSIFCEGRHSQSVKKQMVVSCLDQLTNYQYLSDEVVETAPDLDSFLQQVSLCDHLMINDSPASKTVRRWW
ncbi:adenylosuccinate synthetase [Dyadobacter fermentans]|uniref:Adenylosuccinate synthetase n=1 Tax=Dyadobacter fermentans (strain ATCC 700827 / DSM 18053 / CIP 107007 / KCTC 52180 / NS114) TaxID=471854 RepID=C6W632_DYAFD|nr:adenylosuccinate synthetase [Dyadobacter fermentans]ACT92512.1 Adenylosuccinate synthase [Dyadobacter fermentans DSM 18053]